MSNNNETKAPSEEAPTGKYASKTHCSPLWLDSKPVFLGSVNWSDGKRSGVRIHGTGAELRVDRDEPEIRYRRRLRFIFAEDGKTLLRIHDERGNQVDLADFGSYDTTDKRVLSVLVISEEPNPRFTTEEDVDGTWYHPVDGMEATFVPKGEDPDRYL